MTNPTDVDLCAGEISTLRQTADGFVVLDADGGVIHASGAATRAAWREAVAAWRDEEIGVRHAADGTAGEPPVPAARVLCTGAKAVLCRGDDGFATAHRDAGGTLWFPATDEGYVGAVETFAEAEGAAPRHQPPPSGPVFEDDEDDEDDEPPRPQPMPDDEWGSTPEPDDEPARPHPMPDDEWGSTPEPDDEPPRPTARVSADDGQEGMSPHDAPWLSGAPAPRGPAGGPPGPGRRPRPSPVPDAPGGVGDGDDDEDEDGWGRFEGLDGVVTDGAGEGDDRWFGWADDQEDPSPPAPPPVVMPPPPSPAAARGGRGAGRDAAGGGGKASAVVRKAAGAGRRVAVSASGTKKALVVAVAVAAAASAVFFLTRSDRGSQAAAADPAASATSLCSFVSEDPTFGFTVAPTGSPPTVAETAAEQEKVVALVAGYPPTAPSAATLRTDLAGFWQAAQTAPTAVPPSAAAEGVAAAEESWPAIAGVCPSG